MAINLIKTLQSVQYNLYIKTQVNITHDGSVVIMQDFFQSKGHYQDDFYPIIRKRQIITNPTRVNSIKAALKDDYNEAVNLVEAFLIQNVAYYTGGVVENGAV
jgi:hypothetical protein